MEVISVPGRLRLATAALFLSIPLIVLEVIIVSRAPWWNLPYHNMGYWSLALTLICVPLVSWLVSAKKWALTITGVMGALWVAASVWLSFRFKSPGLGFFSLFLLALIFVEWLWLRREMERSFFDPQMRWFQGVPKPVPGLKCEVALGEKSSSLKVSRIDSDGAFIFAHLEDVVGASILPNLLAKRKFEVKFNFREKEFTCNCSPTLSINRGTGAGLQFVEISPDLRKDIGDFVELLRGEGYV